MKLLKRDEKSLLFSLSANEGDLLRHLVELYPLTPVSYHRAHCAPEAEQGDIQHMLEEAMTAEKHTNESLIRQWLETCFEKAGPGSGCLLRVKLEESEWLLQVLNDVRVGSWIGLGCPDPATTPEGELSGDAQSFQVTMDLSGYFQHVLLDALSSVRDIE